MTNDGAAPKSNDQSRTLCFAKHKEHGTVKRIGIFCFCHRRPGVEVGVCHLLEEKGDHGLKD